MENIKLFDRVQIAGYENTHTKGIGYISYIDSVKCCVSEVKTKSKPTKSNVFPISQIIKL